MRQPKRWRASGSLLLAVLFTLLTVFNAAVACTTFLPARPAPAHSCCPVSQAPAPPNCNKLGCVLSDPAPPSAFQHAIHQNRAATTPGIALLSHWESLALDAVALDSQDLLAIFHQLRI